MRVSDLFDFYKDILSDISLEKGRYILGQCRYAAVDHDWQTPSVEQFKSSLALAVVTRRNFTQVNVTGESGNENVCWGKWHSASV